MASCRCGLADFVFLIRAQSQATRTIGLNGKNVGLGVRRLSSSSVTYVAIFNLHGPYTYETMDTELDIGTFSHLISEQRCKVGVIIYILQKMKMRPKEVSGPRLYSLREVELEF